MPPSIVKIPIGTTAADAEKALIMATLNAHDGKKPDTARVLGISLKTLYNRLNEYKKASSDVKNNKIAV